MNDNKDNTLDIPDFLEDKNETTSTSIDMSIFKMSDEELYSDVPKKEIEEDMDEYDEIPEKKSKGTPVILIILLIILLLTTAVSLIYAFREHKNYVAVNDALTQVQAQVKDLQNQIDSKTKTVEELTKQIEELNKEKEKVLYEVIDGPLTFRKAPNKDADEVQYDGEDFAWDGDEFKVIEIVKDTKDPDYSYAKIADDVYFCIGSKDDVWAQKVEE